MGTLRDAQNILGGLGAEAARHRLDVLREGLSSVNPRIANMSIPTLVLAGEKDTLLPSQDEGITLLSPYPVFLSAVIMYKTVLN